MQKTEKEKMLAGEYYLAGDPQLVSDRKYARELTYAFNHTPHQSEREQILSKLINAKGDVYIECGFQCDYGYNITVGNNFYANYNLIMLDVNTIEIGDDVLCAPGVQILTATHPLNAEERISGLEYALPIRIEDKVWIGAGAIILPGVTIGAGSVIGAGAIVTKDIPPYSVAMGNPCRVVRKCAD